MKFISAILILLVLAAPGAVRGAYNDVSLTTDAVISLTVSGQTVNLSVSGNTANVESITVNENTFTVVLNDPSTLKISSADRYDMSADDTALVTEETCTATESTMSLGSTNAEAAQTVIVSISTDVCSGGTTGGGGGGGSSSSGGGSAPAAASQPLPTPAQTALTGAQLSALASVLASLSLTQAEVSAVMQILGVTGSQPSVPSVCSFTRDLMVGVSGPDVTCLQQNLISMGFSIPAGATSYFGSQTEAAVSAWQTSKGVSPAAGYFGPISQVAWNK